MINSNDKKVILKKLLEPMKNEKKLIAGSLFVGLIAAGLNLSRPIILGLIVQSLVNKESKDKVIMLICLFALSWLLTWGGSLFIRYLSSSVSQKILKNLQVKLLNRYLHIPLPKSENIGLGKIEAYTNSDLPVWSNLYGSTLAEVTHSLAQFVGASITLLTINSRLAWLLIPFLILSALIPLMTSRYMVKISEKAQESISSVIEQLSGFTRGMKDIISFRKQDWALSKYSITCDQNYKNQVKRNLAAGIISIASSSTEIIAYLLVLSVGAYYVFKNEINVGYLVSFLGTIEMIFFPVRYSNDLSGSIQNSYAAAKRVWNFFDIKCEDSQPNIYPSVSLFDVSFTPEGSNKPTIKNLNCTIQPGKLTAIVGHSGSGKTTLLHILSGLYHPTTGSIKFSGNNSVNSSFVWQEPVFFHGSILENLTFGKEQSIEKLNENAAKADIYKTIMSIPGNYHSDISSAGNNFSGGEKKRLALARAFLQSPGFLVLDEPTSGLDIQTADKVMSAIRDFENVTRIISTHRIEEAKKADYVIVMNQGEIVYNGEPTKINDLEYLVRR